MTEKKKAAEAPHRHIRDIAPGRLEAFSDGVIAIIITIMVLELKVPHRDTLESLLDQWPVFLSYALSFVMVAEYWMNHQLLFHLVKKVDNRILWSNLLLLFSISLIPFFTGFMGENHISPFSTAAYSGWMLVCSLSFMVMFLSVARHFGRGEEARCMRRAGIIKNAVATLLYVLAVPAAYVYPALSLCLNVAVAMMYFLPNSWLEKKAA
ncbi:MAG: DUF1211 domain-containing protein [Alphaproteobacteria bacterium]|nr:DUF1211 domain-containing protein [Alphaproteobacteria bacterium]